MSSQGDEPDCGCKVGESARKRGSSTYSGMAADWRSGTSVREITKSFNEEIVERVLRDASTGQLPWDTQTIRRVLQGENVEGNTEVEVSRTLQRMGVDVDELRSDLVSHQTVYRHLRNCLEASKAPEKTPEERIEDTKNTIFALQNRTEVVATSAMERLRDADLAEIGEFDIMTQVTVICEHCNRSMSIGEAISEGCTCSES